MRVDSSTPATRLAAAPPAKPSHVFFGLMTGAIGCLPKARPNAYAPISAATAMMMNASVHHWPPSAGP